ncbi:RHS repeat-associated core domain-containing protein [Pedobacter sp. KR3-3]|uniref:RHS repeat-associated core domain-containing protein n=1 Tax=Pedobacter albus TaxID=3113905 RepID=A0ABU7IAF5_9SPHI|nr:RHS repeat-associated core domain-containing protein [Pedobacter sp. KR3-3]MEE1946448.1 RHS repeat-associated core domain-containing protein [Pedobacter sp. KR3-3]
MIIFGEEGSIACSFSNLGNVRYVFDIYCGAVRKLQEDDYYPFGLRRVASAGNNRYLYNGKELQEELEQYDYGARFYDPIIGRFIAVDKLADHDNQIDKSPYAYVWNNPVMLTDPDENCPICIIVAELLTAGETVAIGTGVVAAGVTYTVFKGYSNYKKTREIESVQDNVSVKSSYDKYLDPSRTKQVQSDQTTSKEGGGKRRKNRLPDVAEPNTMQTNPPGTSTKVYGPNGRVQKEHNKGHGPNAPENEQEDHVHDHKPKPNPNDPDATERQPGRKPKPNERQKDEEKQKRRSESTN